MNEISSIKRKVSSPHSPTPSPGLLLIGCGPFSQEVKYLLHFKAFYASLKFTGMKRSDVQLVHVLQKDRKVIIYFIIL